MSPHLCQNRKGGDEADAFGNISKTGNLSFQPIYNSANQYQSLPGCIPKYDSDGRLTDDGFHSYQWDANGHVTFVSTSACVPQTLPFGSTQTFDARGNMVEVSQSNWLAQYLYDENGYEFGSSHAQGNAFATIPLPGGGRALYNNGALENYGHMDWLGSARLTSGSGHTFVGDGARAPYGEEYAVQPGPNVQGYFAGIGRNLAVDLYDTENREYHPKQGRWISPDPAGMAAVSPANPQTWNRYAYVANNPLSFTDPTGLQFCVECRFISAFAAFSQFDGSTIDGVNAPRETATALLQGGGVSAAAFCDGGSCTQIRQDESGQWQQLVGWQFRTQLNLDGTTQDALSPVWQDYDPDMLASAADVQRIQNAFNASVDRMNKQGLRRPGKGWRNGALNNLGWYFTGYLGCGQQADRVVSDLQILSLDDRWTFSVVQSGPFHQLVKGTSSNSSDPTLQIDPWYNSFTATGGCSK
jgi:RHS repeat-associated protein